MRMTRVVPFSVALVLAAGFLAQSARRTRSDAAADAAAIVADLDKAVKEKDESAIVTATKRISPTYKGTEDAAVKGSLAKAAVAVVKNAKLSPLPRRAALTALVETEDGPAVWKVLAGAYPKDDAEDPDKFNVDIVKAVGALHPDGAIDTLLETFRKAKVPEVAAAAVGGLGNYHKATKQRERILSEIVKAGKNMVPSRSSTKNPSKEAQERWQTVGAAIGPAIDTLTGEKVGDPIEWFKRVDAAKNLKTLFRD